MWWVKDDGNHVVIVQPTKVRVKLNGKVRHAPIEQLRPLLKEQGGTHQDSNE